MRSRPLLGAFCAVLSAILFGTMPLMTRAAYALGSNAYTTAFGRFATGALAAGMVLLFRGREARRVDRSQLRALFRLSLFYAATPVLLYGAYETIDSGLATTLHFTYPVAVMLLSALLFRERPGRREILCAGLCMAGMLLLNGSGAGSLRGMVLAAVSGVAYAGYIVLLGRSGLRSLGVLAITFWLSLLAAGEILVFSAAAGTLRLALPGRVWLWYASLGLFATVIALALFQIGVFLCGSVRASLLSTFEPLTGIVLGVAVLGERLSLRTISGMALILLAVVWLVVPQKKGKQNRSA